VNSYFKDGLAVSSIDKWFTGPVPQFQPVDLGILEHGNGFLADTLKRARAVANNPSQMTWQMVLCCLLLPHNAIIDAPLQNTARKDLSHLNRNLDALIEDIANRCQRIFYQAAGAPSRCAVVSFDSSLHTERLPEEERPTESSLVFPFRERTIANEVNAADLGI
jgi:anaphase-promoting complex subunit 4